MNDKGFTIAISSGKGGAGKTTLSVHLADYCQSLGYPVVLMDLDVEEPNDALFFHFTQTHEQSAYRQIAKWNASICTHCLRCKGVCAFHAMTVTSEKVTIYDELCHGCSVCAYLCGEKALQMAPTRIGSIHDQYTPDGLRVVSGTLDIGQELAAPLIRDVIAYVDIHNPSSCIQILDTAPGVSCAFVAAVENVENVILVAEPTVFGLHDLGLAVKALRKMGKHFGVVVNKAHEGLDRIQQYCEVEQIQLLGSIPYHSSFAQALAECRIIWQEETLMKNALNKITQDIFGFFPKEVIVT